MNLMPYTLPVNIQTVKVSGGPNQSVLYPQISGMQEKEWEEFMNQAITKQTKKLIHQQMGNMPTPVVEMMGTYEIKITNVRFSVCHSRTIRIITRQPMV
jgi:acetamidase/formamidase